MSVREYIGARYIPLFSDPIEWDSTKSYEPLTVVKYQGGSYVSRQSVPEGVEITNTQYWILWADYNAQLEQYRQEVLQFDGRITQNKTDIEEINDALPSTAFDNVNTVKKAIDDNAAILPSTAFNSVNTVKKAIDGVKNTLDNTFDKIEYAFRTGDKVVIFSDSTFQTNTDPATGTVQKSICDCLAEICDATIDNRGTGGQTIPGLLQQLNSMPASAISDADFVIVAEGINDWQSSRNLIDLGLDDIDKSVETLYGQCLDRINQLAPKATIICVTPAFVHSPAMSVVNMNNTGNDYHAYCDVMEEVANTRNVSCLRLDRVLGINETNYNDMMVQSGATGIYVHHTEQINYRIAYMLANGLYGLNGRSSHGNAIEITPRDWIGSGVVSDMYRLKNCLVIDITGGKTFTINNLEPKTNYTLSFVGACDVRLNGVYIARQTSFSWCEVEFKATQASNTITIEPSAGVDNIANLQLSKGRPNFYSAFNSNKPTMQSYTSTEGNFKVDMKKEGSILVGIFEFIGSDITLNQTTEIITLPAAFRGNFKAHGCGVARIGGSIQNFTARMDPSNGKIYPNVNGTADVLEFTLIGMY